MSESQTEYLQYFLKKYHDPEMGDSYDFTCYTKNNIIFIPIPKCASTTLQNFYESNNFKKVDIYFQYQLLEYNKIVVFIEDPYTRLKKGIYQFLIDHDFLKRDKKLEKDEFYNKFSEHPHFLFSIHDTHIISYYYLLNINPSTFNKFEINTLDDLSETFKDISEKYNLNIKNYTPLNNIKHTKKDDRINYDIEIERIINENKTIFYDFWFTFKYDIDELIYAYIAKNKTDEQKKLLKQRYHIVCKFQK